MRRPRRNHSAAFKAKVAIAALKGDQALPALAQQFDAHANQITQWKTALLERASDVFAIAAEKRQGEPDLKVLHAKIGQLTLENDVLSGALEEHGFAISMDGKECWRDNVFVERLWRMIKYEEGLPASLRQRVHGQGESGAVHRVQQRTPAAPAS